MNKPVSPEPLADPSGLGCFSGPQVAHMLERADILRGLQANHRLLFLQGGWVTEIQSDTILAVKDGHSDYIYIVLEGTVQLSTPTANGYLELRNAGPGETIPLSALLGHGSLLTTALAMGSVLAFQLPVADVRRICEDHPDLGRAVYRQIAEIFAERYRKTADRLARGGEGTAGAALESLSTS